MFALEHDLADEEVEELTRELEAIGLEIGQPTAASAAEKAKAAAAGRSPLGAVPRSPAQPTAFSSSSRTSASTSC